MRSTFICFLLSVGILFGFPTATGATTLTIPGTGACESVLRDIATDYERSHPLAKVAIPPSVHSEGGIRQLIDGKAALARVSRPLTPEEAKQGLVSLPFARDAVVFAVGAGVSVRTLTIRQLADIFSGKIDTWEELDGGKGPIRVLYRQAGESNMTRLQATYKEFRNLRYTRKGKAIYYDHETLEMLQKYRNAIGIISRSAILGSRGPIAQISIDGIAPTRENIVAGRYPILTEYAIVYRKGDLPPEGREFIEFLFSDEGKNLLTDHGLAPVEK